MKCLGMLGSLPRSATAGLLLLLAIVVLSACSKSPERERPGEIFIGNWTPPQAEPREIEFLWQMIRADTGRITTDLGERNYLGYFARIRETGAPIITSVYNAWDAPSYALHDWPPDFQGFEPIDYATFVRAYSGQVLATLAEPGGGTLRCNFEPALPEIGSMASLRGQCQVSDGGRIRVD